MKSFLTSSLLLLIFLAAWPAAAQSPEELYGEYMTPETRAVLERFEEAERLAQEAQEAQSGGGGWTDDGQSPSRLNTIVTMTTPASSSRTPSPARRASGTKTKKGQEKQEWQVYEFGLGTFIYQHFAQIAEMDVTLPSGKVYHYVNPGLEGYTGPIVNYSDLY